MPSLAAPASRSLSPTAVGVAAAVITVLIWTSFIVVARASADPARSGALSPLDIAFCRVLGASLILLPWGLWLVRRDRARGTGESSLFGLSPLPWRATLSVGLFGGLLYALLVYSGFSFAPAAHASVLMPGSLPLWTALLAWLFLHERVRAARAIGLGLIVMGDLLVGGASLARAWGGGEVWKGDLLFLTAGLCWACYSVLARHFRLDAVRATVAVTMVALLVFVPAYGLLVLSGAVKSRLASAPLSEMLFQALFQGWGSVVISGITFTRMIQHFGPVRSTLITAVVPGLSALGAVVFLNEPLQGYLLAGLALVTLGILFGVRVPPSTTPEIVASDTEGVRLRA